MKLFKKIGLFFVAALALSSCVDKDPDYKTFPSADVDFTYNVAGDQFAIDYYVVSTIQFNNTSVKTGNVTWDFGDGTTSNEPNPTHKYAAAGNYNVTLTVEGAGSRTYPLMISDIVPVVSVANQSTDIIMFNQTTVDFSVFLPNPEEKTVKYIWTFPEGTTDAAGNSIAGEKEYVYANGVYTPELPVVKFSNVGSQRINIASWFDTEGENRRLEDSYINVQVGLDKPAATLYYAQRDGNIKAIKVVDPSDLPAGTKVFPYDLGVKSGNNPFNIVYGEVAAVTDEGTAQEGWIYILDAGKQYYYVNDEGGTLGDGLITAMRTDGTGVNTVISNVGQAAFSDPFQGFVHEGKLYYSDRNTGISAIDLTTRGAVQGITQSGTTYLRSEFFVKNELLAYYGKSIAYGAIHCGHLRDSKGVWWWGKNYNANGLFRFKESDIHKTQKEAETAAVPYPVALNGLNFKAFTLDETRGNLYVWRLGTEGFTVYPIPGDGEGGDLAKTSDYVAMYADPVNTTASEPVHTTQFALDKETGYVYFGFRPAASETKYKSGVYYYNPDTKKVVSYGETSDQIYGITINPNKTQLY